MQSPVPRPKEFYRENVNINKYYGPLILPPLPNGHMFVVTSSLLQILAAMGLFAGLPSEDPHDHISLLRSVCKSHMGRPYLDMNIVRHRVFLLSLIGDVAIWFNELPYSSIYSCDQLRDVFFVLY